MLRMVNLLILLMAGVVAIPSAAEGRTFLDVATGWDGSMRNGRWMPIFITASDDTTRPVAIELDVPQGGSYVMRLRQYVTLGPQPTTLTVYAPAQEHYGEPMAVVLRDADSGKKIAEWPEEMDQGSRTYNQIVQANQKLVGVTGPSPRLDLLQSSAEIQMRVAGMKPELLPNQPVGYDALDLLVLHRADLNSIERSRQQAIADWVRSGGRLLLWPGPETLPADSPIVQILPAKVGGPKNYVISEGQRKALALHVRFKGIAGRELSPLAGAEAIQLLPPDAEGAEMPAYARSHGFGRVMVAPIDLNELSFTQSSKGRAFFQKVLAAIDLIQETDQTNRGYYGLDPGMQLQQASTSDLQDHLANVPGAGRFGFSYVVWVVLGMMAVVGPVDWFILKRLGRQPWTWVTTTGWIATITIGALFMGQIFKSGDLHYRTVTLIDQADDQTIARSTIAGIYSPRTTEYHLDAAPSQTGADGKLIPTLQPPAGWWQPVSATFYGGSGMKVDVPFRQTTEGNLPQPMTINVWNMRALRGENLIAGEPVIRADLSYVSNGDSHRLEGTITNLSQYALKNVRVQVKDGFATADGAAAPEGKSNNRQRPNDQQQTRLRSLLKGMPLLAHIDAGQTVRVSGMVNAATASPVDTSGDAYMNYYNDRDPPAPDTVWALATGLAGTRSLQVNQAVKRGDRAVIYAIFDQAAPAAVLREDQGAQQRHETIVRALVPVRQQERQP